MLRILPACLMILGLGVAAASAEDVHPCAEAAATQAEKLLKFHTDADDRATVDAENVRKIGTVGALVGKGRFDVLEVEGSVYKANYRLRMIYASTGTDCILMGQEIFERSDPY